MGIDYGVFMLIGAPIDRSTLMKVLNVQSTDELNEKIYNNDYPLADRCTLHSFYDPYLEAYPKCYLALKFYGDYQEHNVDLSRLKTDLDELDLNYWNDMVCSTYQISGQPRLIAGPTSS